MRSSMDVEWTISQPVSRRAQGVPTRSRPETYRRQLALLLRQGSGYTEVSKTDSPYPVLTLSINEDLAVVHRFDDEDTCLLLKSDGHLRSDDTHEFQILDEAAIFTGEFVSTAARGVDVLTAFAEGADVSGLGLWTRL
jgi:hypothetical protein